MTGSGSGSGSATADDFRIAFADALRPLDDSTEIQAVAAQRLCAQLHADAVHFADIHPDGQADVARYTADGVRTRLGHVHLAHFGAAMVGRLRQGSPVAVADVRIEPGLTTEQRAAYDTWGVVSFVSVPLLGGGGLSGALTVAHQTARAWSDEEVALLVEAVARTWRALEIVRTESAIRAAESRVHAELELRVAVRTAELAEANFALAEQIEERTIAEQDRNFLLRQLARVEEGERRRLARELHDQLGQHLTAFSLGLHDVASMLPPESPARSRVAMLHRLSETMTRDVRHLALQLRPPELDDVGLASALTTYVEQWSARFGVAADAAVAGLGDRVLPGDVGTVIYRITQEALTNVAKHAKAKHVSVIVEHLEDTVQLIVEDDGTGFDVEAMTRRATAEGRLGLAGSRERAELVGGTFTVESGNAGTTVFARLPAGPSDRRE